jgi:hypothetical protein
VRERKGRGKGKKKKKKRERERERERERAMHACKTHVGGERGKVKKSILVRTRIVID